MQRIINVIKDVFDPRDRTVAPNQAPVGLKVSFRSEVPYIKDQGSLGSCTANAGTEHLELSFRKHKSELSASVDRSTLRFSPLFQYAQERIIEGSFTSDAGADSRTIFQVLAKIGCCLENEDVYDEANVFVLPTSTQVAEAAQFKIDAYHRILDVETAKTVLQSNYSFTIGIPLFSQFQSEEAASNGLIAMPKGTSIGSHEMHVIGADDSKQVLGQTGAFEVANSWSSTWGDSGFCWLPYAYMDKVLEDSDMWTSHFGKPWVPKPPASRP